MTPSRWLSGRFDGIAVRIAAISIVGLLLAQLAAVGIALLLRPHELQVFQARWLVEATVELARETFAQAPDRRAGLLRARAETAHLSLAWEPVFASDGDRSRPRGPGGRLQRAIAERLPPGYRVEIDFSFAPGRAWNAPDRFIRRVPADDPSWNDGPGGVVPGTFAIAVRGPDGTFLIVRPRSAQIGWGWIVFAAWLGATAAVGAFAAWWAARRLARPLEALAGEAARAGAGLDPQLSAAAHAPLEVRTIGAALARMRGQLVRHVEDRTRLLAAISHDLRTPLTRLRLRAEGIGEESERAKALGDIAEMEHMIAETLDFARADALEAPPERFDLAGLAQMLVDERVDMDKTIAYEGPASLVVEGRPGALKRALANLIDNALAYAGTAQVRLVPSDVAIAIYIEDEGPGIPADRLDDVFRPFVRLEGSRSRETGGAGLGLAVARDVARAHGGDVELRNRVPKGLAAILTLPRESLEPSAALAYAPRMAKALDGIDVAVLAGGLGTRLAAAVPGLPKALAPVAGTPFVEHLLDWLAAQGARRIVFLLGHRADQLLAHLQTNKREGLVFETSIEPQPLGTGGALGLARAKLASDPVLVVNGDTFVDAELKPLVAAHRANNVLATLLAVTVPNAGRYGRLAIKGAYLAGFVEKDPTFQGAAPINAGVYLLSAAMLDRLAVKGACSLERDMFERAAPGTLGVCHDPQARFVDIGTPESWQGAAAVVKP